LSFKHRFATYIWFGHLGWEPEGNYRVRFGVLEGPCRTEQVLDYLEGLAQQAERERMGLVLRYLPRYSPQVSGGG
jgi:hypothetical protein